MGTASPQSLLGNVWRLLDKISVGCLFHLSDLAFLRDETTVWKSQTPDRREVASPPITDFPFAWSLGQKMLVSLGQSCHGMGWMVSVLTPSSASRASWYRLVDDVISNSSWCNLWLVSGLVRCLYFSTGNLLPIQWYSNINHYLQLALQTICIIIFAIRDIVCR